MIIMGNGRVDGKVALITGAARGQGRSHALRLAQEGARIVAIDIAAPVDTVMYAPATSEDLAETVKIVEDAGGEIRAFESDVRDLAGMDRVVAETIDDFGKIDIVVANAGIVTYGTVLELTDEQWTTMIDINLTGVFHTVKAALAPMLLADNGGSIIITSSMLGLKGVPNSAHYTSAKHGLVGLMRVLAHEVSPHNIRVNTIHPTSVRTEMVINDATYRIFRPDLKAPQLEDIIDGLTALNLIPIPYIEPIDVSNAVLWLASDESRYVTGITLPVDAGFAIK
jgi:(+)-trans-carveol dehydrogenase